jgi:type II secretory pathway component PulK
MVLMAKKTPKNANRIGPVTMFLFPVGEKTEESSGQPRSERGIALMVAVMIISIMMMFAAEFIVSSTVNLTRASAQRDNVRAEYIAKSAANWATWLNLFDYGLHLQLAADPAGKAMLDGIGNLWDKLGDVFPFDTPLDVGDIAKFSAAMGLSQVMDSKVLEMIESLGGAMGVKVEDESGRINLNVCSSPKLTTACTSVMLQAEALMGCSEIEQDYMKQNDIKPSEVVRRIKDWVDDNTTAEPGSGTSDENEAYQKRVPPYKAKNSSLDSINDLMLVDGWKRELHSYFSPYLTVWPYIDEAAANSFKLNINAMHPEALRCLFGHELGQGDNKEKFVKKYHELMKKNGSLASGDGDLKALLPELFGVIADGVEKDGTGDRSKWFTTQSTTFRISAKGIVGQQTRSLEFIIQRLNKQQLAAKAKDSTNPTSPLSTLFFRMY